MEKNNINLSQDKFKSESYSNKFRSLNLYILDSQKEIFTNEINSLIPNSILLKEEAYEHFIDRNININKYFFPNTEEGNKYDVINLIHLNEFPFLSNYNFNLSTNKSSIEDNFFIYKIPVSFISETQILELFSTFFQQEINKNHIFKEITFFFEEKKKKNFHFDDHDDVNVNNDGIRHLKNFEIFKKKMKEMNLSKL
jgi:hypothetical protein